MRTLLRRGLSFSLLLALTFSFTACDSGGSGGGSSNPLVNESEYEIVYQRGGDKLDFEFDFKISEGTFITERGFLTVNDSQTYLLDTCPECTTSYEDSRLEFTFGIADDYFGTDVFRTLTFSGEVNSDGSQVDGVLRWPDGSEDNVTMEKCDGECS